MQPHESSEAVPTSPLHAGRIVDWLTGNPAVGPGVALATGVVLLCLAKTLHVCRINDLEAHPPGALFAMIP